MEEDSRQTKQRILKQSEGVTMNLINKLLIKHFCGNGKHKWEHWTAGNQIVKVMGAYYFANVPMRGCLRCERVEEKGFDGQWHLTEEGKDESNH